MASRASLVTSSKFDNIPYPSSPNKNTNLAHNQQSQKAPQIGTQEYDDNAHEGSKNSEEIEDRWGHWGLRSLGRG